VINREIDWGVRKVEYALRDRDVRLKKELCQLGVAFKKSLRLVIATLALGVMLIAVHLEQRARLDNYSSITIGELIQLLDDVR